MHKLHGILAFMPTDVDDRDDLGLCVEGHPHEDPLGHTTYLRHQLVQLQMLAHQLPEIVLVQPLGVLCHALQPTLDGAFIVSKNAAATSTPSPSAVVTSSTRATRVLSRYIGVLARALTLRPHAWHLKYWISSAP